MHITDVRPSIVRGIRSLLLVLLSWLLPVAVLLVGGFLARLCVSGLTALWETGHATALLLTASAVLIILINATFQSGALFKKLNFILRGSLRIASFLLFTARR